MDKTTHNFGTCQQQSNVLCEAIFICDENIKYFSTLVT